MADSCTFIFITALVLVSTSHTVAEDNTSESTVVTNKPMGRGMVGDFVTRVAFECFLTGDWQCVQTRTWRAFTQWFTTGTIDDSRKQEVDPQGNEVDGGNLGGRALSQELAMAAYEGFSAIFLAKNEDERQEMVLRGSRALDNAVHDLATVSGRKKKTKKKDVAALIQKIILLKSAIFNKISTLIELKTFVVMKLMLIISAMGLVMQISKKKGGGGGSSPVIKIVQVSSGNDEHGGYGGGYGGGHGRVDPQTYGAHTRAYSAYVDAARGQEQDLQQIYR